MRGLDRTGECLSGDPRPPKIGVDRKRCGAPWPVGYSLPTRSCAGGDRAAFGVLPGSGNAFLRRVRHLAALRLNRSSLARLNRLPRYPRPSGTEEKGTGSASGTVASEALKGAMAKLAGRTSPCPAAPCPAS